MVDMIARIARAIKDGLDSKLDPGKMEAILNAHVSKTMKKAFKEALQ